MRALRYGVLFLFWVAVSPAWARECLEKHAAMDFGSGTTKALVAEVDVCEKKILKVLYEQRLALALNEALEKSVDQKVPLAVVETSRLALQKMFDEVRAFHPQKTFAVATSVFRVAKNGKELAQKISELLGAPIQIITQEREAELGYWSALAQKETLPRPDFIVWDIGGGSMQMYAQHQEKIKMFKGDLASVTFKNRIIEELQFKKPQEVSSPNPLGLNKNAAVQLAKNHAALKVPAFFKNQPQEARWIGVGGVLSMSVQKQVDQKASAFSLADLEKTLTERSFLKDDQIKSDYRVSDISNLALVLGYMKALGIQKVETVQASLGQGLIYKNLKNQSLKN